MNMASLMRSIPIRPHMRSASNLQIARRHSQSSSPRYVASAEAIKERRQVSERFSLKDKTTIITGGARGIGLSLVEAAAEAGSNVAIFDRLDEPQIDVSKLGVQAKYYRYESCKKGDKLQR